MLASMLCGGPPLERLVEARLHGIERCHVHDDALLGGAQDTAVDGALHELSPGRVGGSSRRRPPRHGGAVGRMWGAAGPVRVATSTLNISTAAGGPASPLSRRC